MTRWKNYIRQKGIKLECDYPYMPHGEIDSVWVQVTSNCLKITRYYYTYGTYEIIINRAGIVIHRG